MRFEDGGPRPGDGREPHGRVGRVERAISALPGFGSGLDERLGTGSVDVEQMQVRLRVGRPFPGPDLLRTAPAGKRPEQLEPTRPRCRARLALARLIRLLVGFEPWRCEL